MKRITKFLINGAILTGVSVLLQSADSIFTVYISGKIGADGVGLFGLVMSVYRFAVTLALSGLGLAATRTVSEYLALGREKAALKSGLNCMLLSLGIGLFSSVLLFVSSRFISSVILKNINTELSLRVLSLSLIPISLSSSLGGIFLAYGKPVFSAVGNMISFLSRIISTVFLLKRINVSVGMACFALTCGMTVSEWAGFLFLAMCFIFTVKGKKTEKEKGIIKKLLSVSVPVALSSYVRSALYTVEQLLIPVNLRKYGDSETEALAKYGIIKGMVLPIILMPSALMYSFSGLLVPELTKSDKTGNKVETKRISDYTLKLSFFYSIGVYSVLYFFSDKLSEAVYHSPAPGTYIKILAPLVIVMYLDGAVDNLLKGLGQQLFCMKVNIADSALSLILVCLLVPIMGINGYVAVILISEMFNTVLSVYKLISLTGCKIKLWEYLIIPFALSYISCTAAKFIFGNNIYLLIISSSVTYIFLSILVIRRKQKRRS